MSIFIVLFLAVLSGFLYYVGGAGKEEAERRIPWFPSWLVSSGTRDLGCAACAIITLGALYGWHWSLALVFFTLFGALTEYHKWLNPLFKKPKTDCFWFNWLATGVVCGLALAPYVVFFNHNWAGYAILVAFLGASTMLWSEAFEKVEVEASGRGALLIISLAFLSLFGG